MILEKIIPYKVHWFLRVTEVIFLLIFFWILVGFVLPTVLPGRQVQNSEISGLIIRSEVWSGTIRVAGDIVTMPQTKITILPGTKVLVNSTGDKTNIDFVPWHLEDGINTGFSKHGVEKGQPFWDEKQKIQLHFSNLEALGTKDAPITISANDLSKSSYDFNLITVSQGDLNFIDASNYRRMQIGDNVKISNSSFSHTGECAICIYDGSPKIIDNQFDDGTKDFIVVGDALPTILGNIFGQSSGDGVVYTMNTSGRSEIRLINNQFTLNSHNSVVVVPLDEGGSIVGNTFTSGNIQLPCNSQVVMKQNQIFSQVVFKSSSDCKGIYTFDYNFWGLTKEQDILNLRVIGDTDNFKVKVPYILKAR